MNLRSDSGPVVSAGAQSPAPGSSPAPSVDEDDPTLHVDQLDRQAGTAEAGRTNLFQYRQMVVHTPPRTGSTTATRPGGGDPAQPNPFAPGDVKPQPTTPPPPAPPPPITLKYQGFGSTGTGSRLTAFLSDDQRHFNVTEGEVLMGRYRIVRVTESAVEVEDLQFNRRQALPLVKP